jgi:hypothetical protein
MSNIAIYAIPAIFVLAAIGIIAWAIVAEWRKDRRADDTPPGDHSHHPDSIRAAQRANGRDADA